MIDSRRKFIGTMATGLATTLASPKGVLGANDRIRMGIIGAGARGMELVHWALACPNLDFVAFADIYTKRLEDAKALVPNAATYLDHRRLRADKTIDAAIHRRRRSVNCAHLM